MTTALALTGAGTAGTATATYRNNAAITVPAGKTWVPKSVHVVWTACAKTGNRAPQIRFLDPASGIGQFVTFAPVIAASETKTLDAFQGLPTRATYINSDHAVAPMPPAIWLPPGYQIVPYDAASITDGGLLTFTGAAAVLAATTIADAGASFPAYVVGYTVAMLGSTGIITARADSTHITFGAGMAPVLTGTADASDATTMTLNAGAWATNALVGGVVGMGGSTANVVSNTATVVTIDAWNPLAPTTGAFTITGPYTITGDILSAIVSFDQYEVRGA